MIIETIHIHLYVFHFAMKYKKLEIIRYSMFIIF